MNENSVIHKGFEVLITHDDKQLDAKRRVSDFCYSLSRMIEF